ncbi:hypothetical protein TPELBph1_CDS0034 [Terrisporobacter phage TPELB_ph1]
MCRFKYLCTKSVDNTKSVSYHNKYNIHITCMKL